MSETPIQIQVNSKDNQGGNAPNSPPQSPPPEAQKSPQQLKEEEAARRKQAEEQQKIQQQSADAQTKFALTSATTVASVVAIERVRNYHASRIASLENVSKWHRQILAFFAYQRGPYVKRVNNVIIRGKNGETVLGETRNYINALMETFNKTHKDLTNMKFFGEPLKKQKDNVPQIQPMSACDPSILGLCTLTTFAYNDGIKYKEMMDQLKKMLDELTKMDKQYDDKCFKKVKEMNDVAKSLQDLAHKTDGAFKEYQTYVANFATIFNHSTPYTKMSEGKRKDAWVLEQKYREHIVKMARNHKKFFVDCDELLDNFNKMQLERSSQVHGFMRNLMNLQVQFYSSLHNYANQKLMEMDQVPEKAMSNRQVYMTQTQKENQDTTDVSVDSNGTATHPPPIPVNVNMVASGFVQEKKGVVFKDWTNVYLVLTRENFIHCYSADDIEDPKDFPELFGQGTIPVDLITDPSKARFNLKENKTAASAKWTADVYNCTAELAPPKEKFADTSFILKLHSTGMFSGGFEKVIRCGSAKERDLWMRIINDHTGAPHMATMQVAREKIAAEQQQQQGQLP